MNENPTRKFYDRISGIYDTIADGGEHLARDKGLELLDVQPGERVLEVGYGTGHSLICLAQAVGDNGHVDGVDISAGMCQVARKRVAQNGLESRVTLKVAETPPLPYEDGQFDVVCMSFTLELFPLDTIPVLLKEIGRVLRNGGRLGVVSMATTTSGERDSLLELTYKWMHRHFPHIVDCQPIPAEDMLTEAGFELSRSQRISLFTMPVAIAVGTYHESTFAAVQPADQSVAETIEQLVEKLVSSKAVERMKARQRLSELNEQATDALTDALTSENQHLRWEAAKCLSQTADRAAIPALIQQLSDLDSDVRWVCSEALISRGDAALVPLLEALTKAEARNNFELYQEAHHVFRELLTQSNAELLLPLLVAFGQSEPQVAVPVEAGRILQSLGR